MNRLLRLVQNGFKPSTSSLATDQMRCGVVFINTPLAAPNIKALWQLCDVKVACDGAVDRLLQSDVELPFTDPFDAGSVERTKSSTQHKQ